MSVTHVSTTVAGTRAKGIDARTALLAAIIVAVFLAGLFGAITHPIDVDSASFIAGV